MHLPLFRKEAVDHQRDRLYGELILVQPMSYWVLTFFLVAIVAIAGWFLINHSYTRKEKVPGLIVPREGIVTVYQSQAGILTNLNVVEGMEVKESDDLFSMVVDRRMADGEYVGLKIIEQMGIQKAYYERRLAYERERSSAALETNEDKITQLRKKIDQLKELLRIQTNACELALNAYMRMQDLFEDNVVPHSEVEEAHSRHLSAQQQLGSLDVQLNEAVSSLNETILNTRTLEVNRKRELADIRNQLTELAKQQTQAEGQREMVVNAPVAGRITAVTANVGQRLDPAKPLFSIIPEGSSLQANLYLPTRSIGFLEIGQKVNISYEAFPYQKFGTYPGTIGEIAKSVIMPGESASGLTFQEPVYKVVAILEKQYVQAYGREIPLRSGMTLSADVVLDKRTLFEWLLEPVYGLRGKI